MKKEKQLPIEQPMFSTYHYQGNGSAILHENMSIRNWYLNNAIMLVCSKKFLDGFTTPELSVEKSSVIDNPFIEKMFIPIKCLGESFNPVVKRFIDCGYYVSYWGIDDYYVEGKTWFNERHFLHDGLICGYDQKDCTYTLFAYDKNWVYNVFKTSQSGINRGRRAGMHECCTGEICALKPYKDHVYVDSQYIISGVEEYLRSTINNYPLRTGGKVRGIAVHNYLLNYLDMLKEGKIPYERMDKRVFRLVWEHKKVMRERLHAVEQESNRICVFSEKYRRIVDKADKMRYLYATYSIKKKDSLLSIIANYLYEITNEEMVILSDFCNTVRGL